jgi:PAS domain S-box-containing protein
VSNSQEWSGQLNEQLLELVQAVSLATDREDAFEILLERTSRLVPCDGASVMWFDGDHLEVLASTGPTAPMRGLRLPAGQMGAARAALDTGHPRVVSDTVVDAGWQPVPGEEQVRAWMGAPLILEDRILGLLEWTAREPAQLNEDHATVIAEVAHSVTPILYRIQLLDDTRQRFRELVEPRLSTVPKVMDVGAELQPLAYEALEFTDARHAFVFLRSAGRRRLRCVAAAGEKRERLKNVTLRGDGTLGGWSVPLTRSSGWLGSGLSDREVMADLGIGSTLILPLRARSDEVGMLGVAEPSRGRKFSRDALRLMTHLASEASLIVERTYYDIPEAERYDFEMVLQSSPLSMGVLTLTGDIQVCNPAMAALLARSGDRLVGRNLSEFLAPGDGRRFDRMLEEVAIAEHRQQLDVRLLWTGQGYRHVRIWLALARLTDDAAGDLVVVMEDITSLKILEQERVEHLAELSEKHKQLQELDQLKSRFVSNVSHDLRMPLAVIKLYATLARRGRPEKRAHYLQTIEQETQRLETMVENVLDLTRMDRHALRVNLEALVAGEVIDQVLETYDEAAKTQGVQLRRRVRGDLPTLWADRNHVIQMLTNLVDNALKYTSPGGEVWVAARELESDGRNMLELAVGDTGIGIPADEQEMIFERFYRGTNNTRSSPGTGLGLAIVRDLMARHGGQVTLRSKEGEGSVFSLQFPFVEGDGPPDEAGEQ